MIIKTCTVSVYVWLLFCLNVDFLIAGTNGDDCHTPKRKTGRCVELENCPSLFELSQQKPLSNEGSIYLKLSRCDDNKSKVCCEDNFDESTPAATDTRSDVFESCSIEGVLGECITVEKCPVFRRLLEVRPFTAAKAEQLRRACCGFEGIKAKVCCPRDEEPTEVEPRVRIDSTLLPKTDTCGPYIVDKIIGGKNAELHEYPWMALLSYKTPNGVMFKCGGSLINNRYVLTAAHCVSVEYLEPQHFVLRGVRLGEYKISSLRDCTVEQDVEICADPVIDVGIAKKIVHEGYIARDVSQQNDIALIRLDTEISYTDYVKPICIATEPDLLRGSYAGVSMIVAGWGTTETNTFSDILQKVEVMGKHLRSCKSVYSGKTSLTSKQLCAGGDHHQDSCGGDSGGPLMVVGVTNGMSNLYIAGIVSYGPSECGLENWPAVYTKVSGYVSWIVNKLER